MLGASVQTFTKSFAIPIPPMLMRLPLRLATLVLFGVLMTGGTAACDLFGGCTEPPDTHKGAELTGCSGASDDEIRCCSYSGPDCSYTLCRDSCGDDFSQDSFFCAPDSGF